MSLPCSPTMISACVDVLCFLSEYTGTIDQIAHECGTNIHTVRRAINALRKKLPIEHVRFNEAGERVDFWRMKRNLSRGEAVVLALTLFVEPRHADQLLERARVRP